MDCSQLVSSVHGIFQARINTGNWLLFPTSRDPPNPGVEPESLVSPAPAGGIFYHWHRLRSLQVELCPPKRFETFEIQVIL